MLTSIPTNFHVTRAQNRPSVTMETCSKIRGSFLETFGLFLIKPWKMYFFSQKCFEIVHKDCLQVCAKFRGHKLRYAPQVGQFPPQKGSKNVIRKIIFSNFSLNCFKSDFIAFVSSSLVILPIFMSIGLKIGPQWDWKH